MIKKAYCSSSKVPDILGPILIKLVFSRNIFEESSNIKFHENPSTGSPVVPCGRTEGQTDMKQLIVAFRNFVNAPKK